MSGLGLSDLPLPPRAYLADQRTGRSDGALRFEPETRSIDETLGRAASLRKYSETAEDASSAEAARVLAKRLQRQAEGREPFRNPASPIYMRDRRIRLAGALWQLTGSPGGPPLSTATIIKRGWDLPFEEVLETDPRAICKQFLTDCRRANGGVLDGFMLASLHGEFEPNRRRSQLHLHLAADRRGADTIDKLRRLSAYQASRGVTDDEVSNRVRISRAPLTNLPDPLTYLFQSYWPCRWIGQGEGGHRIRQRGKSRMPEPFHSEWLLWLSRWRLDDLMCLTGARVGRSGLRLTRPNNLYTNGDD